MQYLVTFIQQIVHTVPVEAKSFNEAEHKADIQLSLNPNAFKKEEDFFLECVEKKMSLPF